MSVVSVRVPDDTVRTLTAAGLSPGDIAKQALEREARRIRVLADLEWLKSHRIKSDRRTEGIVREIRDNE